MITNEEVNSLIEGHPNLVFQDNKIIVGFNKPNSTDKYNAVIKFKPKFMRVEGLKNIINENLRQAQKLGFKVTKFL